MDTLNKIAKKKVVLLFCGVRTGHFGAGAHIEALLPALKSSNEFDFSVIKTDDTECDFIHSTFDEGVEVLHIPQPENRLFLTKESTNLQIAYAGRLTEIIIPFLCCEQEQEIVFIANSCDYLNLCVALKKVLDCKVIYVHHAWFWKSKLNVPDEVFAKIFEADEGHLHQVGFARDLVFHQVRMADIADQIITVTFQAKKLFVDLFSVEETKVRVIYNGVDFDIPFPERHEKGRLREKLGFSEGDRVILFTGRVKAAKGVGYLLEGVKTLLRENNNVYLIIAGGGDIEDFVCESAPFWKNILYTGELSRSEIDTLYHIADIGVLPSLYEQCSFTALEMRRNKIPIIVSDVDGLSEMYEHGQTALKLLTHLDQTTQEKLLDCNQIVEFLQNFLDDPELGRELANNAYVAGVRDYGITRMRDEYIRAILSC